MNTDSARRLAQMNGAVSSWTKWTTAIGVVLLGATSLVAQVPGRQNRISQTLSAKPNVEIAGTVHPLTAKSTDLGAVNSNMPLNSLTLQIKPSAAQKKEIASLLVSLQDRKSPQYHKWLTQADYGSRFGLTGSDLSQLKSWVTGQGFAVKHVSKSLNSITFSGKAWQVESAFHTQLHQYKLDGETHFANATALQVPARFADVVMAVRGLDDFRPKPNAKRMSAHPNTAFGTSNFLSPADWGTIYNVPTFSNPAIDGTGVHVGIVGQSYAPPSDIDTFRTAAGLPLPTNLNYVCVSTAVPCTDAASISSKGDLAEADIDIEWAGGIAPNATVDYIYTAADDPLGVFGALQYAIVDYTEADGSLVPIISMSYDFGCEAQAGLYPGEFDLLGQQASLQGQTLVVSAGDSGAAGCDATALSPFATGVTPATGGLAVTVPADNPLFTAVGGTTLSGDISNPSTYWDAIGALMYIPETPWNETGTTGQLAAGGGGESTIYPVPTWQIDPNTNMPLIPTALGRLVPDVAFAAASGHDGYLYCSSDAANGNLCTNVLGGFTSGTPTTAGGTSVATASFAGLLTLLVQQYGPMGNINPTLYAIAANNTTSPSAFNDIASGDTNVPCSGGTGCVGGFIGFPALTGYDEATGLGSVNGQGLFAALVGLPFSAASTTTLSATSNTVVFGNSFSLVATVVPTNSQITSTPTGTVTLSTASGTFPRTPQELVAGVANITVPTTTANGLGVGSYSMTASYADPTAIFYASHGLTALTVTPAATTTTITQPSPLALGGTTILTATVASTTSSEFPTGTVTFTLGGTTLGTGTLTGGIATFSLTASSAKGFVVGPNVITAKYGGDTNFTASTGSTTLTVNVAVVPTMVLTPSLTNITPAQALTVKVAVNAPSGDPTPTGSVILTGGGFTSVAITLTAGSATIAVPAGSLSFGADTLTVTYTPDTVSSGMYISTSNTTSVTVADPTYTLSANPSSVHGSSTVTLTLTTTNYTGPVDFATSVTLNGVITSAVQASAPSVPLTMGQTGTSVLTITIGTNAANHAPAVPWKSGGALVFCAVLLGVPFGRRKRVIAVLLTALAISLAGLLVACGGGGGGSKTTPPPAARTYTVTVTPTGTSPVKNPSPVVITVTVP